MVPSLLIVAAFLIGSIPTGYVIGRIYGIDIRLHGSGNIGATNALRLLGKRAGILTFVGDAGKGFLAALLPALVIQELSEALSPITATLALLGHCYSPFLNFRGGKGVATGCGAFLYLTPLAVIISSAVFAIARKLSGYVSVGSLCAAVVFAALVVCDFLEKSAWETKTAAIVCVVFILLRHRENMSRLLHHAELRGPLVAPKESVPSDVE